MRVLVPLLLLLTCAADAAYAQARGHLRFRTLGVDEGLPQTFVPDIAQDSMGYIWVATAGGIARYDGYTFRSFQPESGVEGALPAHAVNALHVSPDGTLWAGLDEAGLVRFEAKTETWTSFPHGRTDSTGLISPRINAITSLDDALWIATSSELSRFDRTTGTFRHYRPRSGRGVGAVLADSGGVWALTPNGLHHYDPTTDALEQIATLSSEADTGEQNAFEMVRGPSGELWLGTSIGLLRYDPATQVLERPTGHPALGRAVYDFFLEPRTGWLWLAGNDGLHLYDIGAERVIDSRSNAPGNPLNLPPSPIRSVLSDRTGHFWVGTPSGAAYADFLTTRFTTYHPLPSGFDERTPTSVRAILPLGDSAAIVSVHDEIGLVRLDLRSGEVVRLPEMSPELKRDAATSNTAYGVSAAADGGFWAVFPRGVERRSASGSTLAVYSFPDERMGVWAPAFVHEDQKGRAWVGSGDFRQLDQRTGEFEAPFDTPMTAPTALHEDDEGRLWIANGDGLTRFDPDTGERADFAHDPNDPASLGAGSSIALAAQGDSVLWLGQSAGVTRFDVRTEKSRRFTTTVGGLPDNFANGVVVDSEGSVWVSTNGGLARLAQGDDLFVSFPVERGLQAREYNRGAYARSPGGIVFFGGISGLNAFNPATLRENPYPPTLHLLRAEEDEAGALFASPHPTDGPPTIRFPAKDHSDVTLRFVGIHFSEPSRNRYQIRLDGLDDAWGPVTTDRTARYTNLPPGEYALYVRAASAFGVWSDDVLLASLVLPSPWWMTTWFRLLVLLAGVGALLALYRYRVGEMKYHRRELRREVSMRTAELVKEKRLTEQQARELERLNEQQRALFANVSHETRTPLTLIIGPVGELLTHPEYGKDPDLRSRLSNVQRNAHRLQSLVDRILDLSRLEAGHVAFNPRPLDLGKLTAHLVDAFSGMAGRRQITLVCHVPDESVPGLVDPSLVEHIVFNLVVNALTYTPSEGRIDVALSVDETDSGRVALMTVSDTGIGIPEEAMDHIFDRFTLAHQGQKSSVGIGLALVKESVNLHGGDASVESVVGEGTTFSIRLPLGIVDGDALLTPELALRYADGLARYERAWGQPYNAQKDAEHPEDAAYGKDRTTILIVEDDDDVRRYVCDVLTPAYHVVEAADGADGLAQARVHLPDLIVSDVAMPVMDGLTLCRTVKSDPDLGFLPVLLLTAMADVTDRVAGFDAQADGYLAKPFDARELLATVRSLLASRAALRERLPKADTPSPTRSSTPDRPPEPPTVVDAFPDAVSASDELREQIETAVHASFADAGFSARELADSVGLSPAHLRRRMGELGMASPVQTIRAYRLGQGALLLKKQVGTVAEIAYAVGFNSVSYFTRSFRDAYGDTPSAYAEAAPRDEKAKK